jgi:hypothetical protein
MCVEALCSLGNSDCPDLSALIHVNPWREGFRVLIAKPIRLADRADVRFLIDKLPSHCQCFAVYIQQRDFFDFVFDHA